MKIIFSTEDHMILQHRAAVDALKHWKENPAPPGAVIGFRYVTEDKAELIVGVKLNKNSISIWPN